MAVSLAVASVWLGSWEKSLMVMGHGIHSSPSKQVTCLSDVSRGRGPPSSASRVNKKATDSLPTSSFHSTSQHSSHPSKNSINLHKTNLQTNPTFTMDAVK